MVYRVYVEKKKGQTHEADGLMQEIRDFLQIKDLCHHLKDLIFTRQNYEEEHLKIWLIHMKLL